MSEKRRVAVSSHKWVAENSEFVLAETREADFHCFGMSYEEFESGPGMFSVAIVEYDDGQVDTVVAEHIRFLDRE